MQVLREDLRSLAAVRFVCPSEIGEAFVLACSNLSAIVVRQPGRVFSIPFSYF